MKSIEWYLENDKDKLKGATVKHKMCNLKGDIVAIQSVTVYNPKFWTPVGTKTMLRVKFEDGNITKHLPSSLELVTLNNNINEEIYKTMEVNVINNDIIKANTAIKVMWQGDDFAYNCIVQYSTGKYIYCYSLSAETNEIERYAISADDLESGKVMILEIMEE